MRKPDTPQYIAAAATLLIAFGLLLLLWHVTVGSGREQLAASSIPEEPDMEEVYIEPELLTPEPANDAEQEAAETREAEAEALGLPEKTETPVEKTPRVEHSVNPKPSQSNERLNTQTKPSPVKTDAPKANPKPDANPLSDRMGAQFNAHNGSTTGRQGGAGSGGHGTSVTSQGIKGRTFNGYAGKISSDKSFRAEIKVKVTVDAAGKVKNAWLISAGGAPSTIAQQCVAWARKCSWSAKPGAADADGIITYNVVINP